MSLPIRKAHVVSIVESGDILIPIAKSLQDQNARAMVAALPCIKWETAQKGEDHTRKSPTSRS